MINWLKIKLIRLTDAINAKHDPFQEFTRPAQPKYQESLHAKADKFEHDFVSNFWVPKLNIFEYTLNMDDRLPPIVGDQALWHGVATAMWALKWAVTKNQVAHNWLTACVDGLAAHQPGGALIRGLDPVHEAQVLDASNDQASGHLLGLYFAWLFGQPMVKAQANYLLKCWADNVHEHRHALVNPDGKPTKYGKLVDGWRTDPLRLSLCVAIYACAWNMSKDHVYLEWAADLLRKYGSLVDYPKVKLFWYDTQYDTHRAAIHLALILDAFADKTLSMRQGLFRLRAMTRKLGNVWVNALCDFGGVPAESDRRVALKVLSEFTLEDKQYSVGRINSTDSTVDKTVWNGKWVSRQPIPRWRVQSQDFFWQRNLYNIDDGDPKRSPGFRHNGLDFLAAYWLMRKTNLLVAGD